MGFRELYFIIYVFLFYETLLRVLNLVLDEERWGSFRLGTGTVMVIEVVGLECIFEVG